MKKKTILVTGFGPFPGQPDNPSAAVAAALEGFQGEGFIVCSHILPTEFRESRQALDALIAAHDPDIVICFGVAPKRPVINLETIARNENSTASPDASGKFRKTGFIHEEGAPGYMATLPLPGIKEALDKRGLSAVFSEHAGNYVCNHMFYHLMHKIAHDGSNRIGGFIHIPDPGKSAFTLEQLVEAAEIIITESVKHGDQRRKPFVIPKPT